MRKDLVIALKKETCLNVEMLSKFEAMPPELSILFFKENALKKPSQTLFNHLSHYLVSIIDHPVSTSLSWPLYDSKTAKAYRNELASFISDYSNKGLLNPVMSSYLVNPGCFKVTMLIYQMSRLAIQNLLTIKMKKDSQKKLYSDITEKFESQEKEGFLEQIEKEKEIMLSKVSNHLRKRKVFEEIAELLRNKISVMESKTTNAQKYLDDLVDGSVKKLELDDDAKKVEILAIKNVHKPSQFIEKWWLKADRRFDEMESKWNKKVLPLIALCKNTQMLSESLLSRCTGEADKNTYMVEYNYRTDFICTKDLQSQVNSQQKCILKNIVKKGKLSFPNLIRGFLIAISFILKDAERGDEIYKFNESLEGGRQKYSEIVLEMRAVMDRITNAEAKLQPSPPLHNLISVRDIPEIPLLPDLSILCCTRELQSQVLFESFTPLSMSKHQFNLPISTNLTFAKTKPKSVLIAPFCQEPKDDLLKSLISCRVSTCDHPNQNVSHNLSVTSQGNRAIETTAACSSGFTKEQILKLLSTKRSSSFKKFKYRTERPDIQIKEGCQSRNEESTNTSSNESNTLFRSYSPTQYKNREKRPLSIMQKNTPSLLEVSGIAVLDKDSSYNAPPAAKQDNLSIGKTNSIPTITVTAPDNLNEMLREFNADNLIDTISETVKTETPKGNTYK